MLEVHDLYLMDIDLEKSTCRYASRDFRLTHVHGHVVKNMIA